VSATGRGEINGLKPAYLSQELVRVSDVFQQHGDLTVVGRALCGHSTKLALHALHGGCDGDDDNDRGSGKKKKVIISVVSLGCGSAPSNPPRLRYFYHLLH
jgi:hypothetical protein